MKKLSVFVLIVLSMTMALSPIYAKQKEVTVKVNGLVCAFCAQGVTKRFMALPSVQSVQVSLEKKTVVIELKPKMELSDKAIRDTVKDAGYITVDIKR